MFSFYNAGSATNFSNHAYKMGPMHWGILERGSKTASGAYLLMPATLGTFSVCFGKLMHHPNTRNLPFAYLIADGDKMFLIPGRNITTVGLYRDIKKWPKRDLRAMENRKSIVNFDWLSPYSVGEVLKGSSSRAMAAQGVCYVDLFHEGVEGGRPLSIECQGMVVHASNESVLSDADRLAALQRMGHDVLFLTSR